MFANCISLSMHDTWMCLSCCSTEPLAHSFFFWCFSGSPDDDALAIAHFDALRYDYSFRGWCWELVFRCKFLKRLLMYSVDTPFLPSISPQFYFLSQVWEKYQKLKIIKNTKNRKFMKIQKNKNIESGFGRYQFFMGTRASMES